MKTIKEKKKNLNYLKRCGLADAHGLECYYDYSEIPPSELMMFFLRAQSNRQRHCVMFVVEVTKEIDITVNGLISKFKFAEALSLLKEYAKSVQFPKECIESYTKSWKLIPNSGLDPWS